MTPTYFERMVFFSAKCLAFQLIASFTIVIESVLTDVAFEGWERFSLTRLRQKSKPVSVFLDMPGRKLAL